MKTYLKNIKNTVSTFSKGLMLTFKHMLEARTMRDPVGVKEEDYFEKKEGIITLQYPFEELPVPVNGRYQLHNEIDDCIVCDKCAKVCPVNCIDIEPIKAVDEIGKTSDGTPRRIYAAKFDIDMAKCCFCGLCTTVCPTECLTMTNEYDFSVFDLNEHNFVFGNMSDSLIKEKQAELDKFNEEKEAAKLEKERQAAELKKSSEDHPAESDKPAFKPKVKIPGASAKPTFKPKVKTTGTSEEAKGSSTPKPVFKPKIKGKTESESTEASTDVGSKKPVFRPKIKSKTEEGEDKAKPAVKPVFKPKIKANTKTEDQEKSESGEKKKPVFRPKIKAKSEDNPPQEEKKEQNEGEEKKTNKPIFRPKIKPKKP